jgi:VanZ family protein
MRKVISVLWVVSIAGVCYFSLIPTVEFPVDFKGADLAYHALTYLWLSLLPSFIFGPGKRGLLAAMLMIPLGVALEFGQTFVPGRNFSVFDIAANSCGTLLGVICGKYARAAVGHMMKL